MTTLSKGANTSVTTGPTEVVLAWRSGPDLDISALLLTATGKVRSDADFIFYNQPQHAASSVRHLGKQPGRDALGVDLGNLEPQIERVVIAISADGGTFGQVDGLSVGVAAGSHEQARFDISGTSETAMVAGEFYRRGDGWKFRAVGQGYDAGLAGLATDFGISVDDAPEIPAQQPGVSLKKQKLLSLEKDLEQRSPQLLSLTKTAAVSLDKRGLGEHTARVALCLDISGSMNSLYRSGKIQQLVERVLAVGVRFDDDGQVDCFLFGKNVHTPGPIGIDNFTGYTQQTLRQFGLEGSTNYGLAMQRVREHYFGGSQQRREPLRQPLPVYVMFVTDGQTMDQDRTREQVISSSFEPLFWQFMAIGDSPDAVDKAPAKAGFFGRARRGGSQFRFLEELDDMGGRYLDNADFFAVTDPANLPDSQLFDLMTTEYPGWLQHASQRGLIG